MQRLVLLLLALVLFAVGRIFSNSTSSIVSPLWEEIPKDHLLAWYPMEVDQCMMARGELANEFDYFHTCNKVRVNKDDKHCEASSHCFNFPDSFLQRPVGYDSDQPHSPKLVEMLLNLNKTGRSLFFVGDSMTRQMISALRCQLKRIQGDIYFDPADPKREKFGHSSTVVYIPTAANVTVSSEMHFFAIWDPFLVEFQQIVLRSVENLLLNDNVKGLVLIANIGLHERSEDKMYDHLVTLFDWVQSAKFGDMKNKHNSFLYRESSMQHFPNSSSGYYSVWLGKNKKGTGTSRNCTPHDVRDPFHIKGNFRYLAETRAIAYAQKRVEAEADKRQTTQTHIGLLSFMNMSTLFAHLHPSSTTSRERFHFDCTHYCGFAPLLWQVLFYQMYTKIA